jgi:hypothetical protein
MPPESKRDSGRCIGHRYALVALLIFVALAGSRTSSVSRAARFPMMVRGSRPLVANPKISVDSLRPLVQQKPDEAYSTPKVEGTITGAGTLLRSLSVSGSHQEFFLYRAFAGYRYSKPDALPAGCRCQSRWGPTAIPYLGRLLPSPGSD